MVLKTIREKPGYRYNWLGAEAEGVSPTQQRKGRTILKRAESSLSSCPYDERSSQNVVRKNTSGKTVDLGDYTLEMDGKKEEITIQFSTIRNSSRLNSCGGNQNQNAFPSVFLLEECGKSAASDETRKRQNTGWGNDDDLPSSLPPSACCNENEFAATSDGDCTRKSRSSSKKGGAEESSSKHSKNRLKAVQERLKSQNAKMKERLKRQKKEMKKRLECQRKKMLEMDILPCTGTWFNSGVSASSSSSTTSSGSSTASCSYQLTLSEYQTEREDRGARKENGTLTPSSSMQSHKKRRALNLPVTETPPLTTSTTTKRHPRSNSNGEENRQPDEIFKTSDPHVESQVNQMIEIQESPSFTGPWWSSSQSWQFLEDFDDEGAGGENKIDFETASTMRQSYNDDSRRMSSKVGERLSSISDPSPSSNEEMMMMMRRRHKIATIIDENIRQPEELKKKLSTIFNENIKRPEEMKKRLQNQRKKMKKSKIEMSPRVTPRLSTWRATHKSLLDPSWDASEETKLDASTRTEDLPIPTTNHHHRHRRHRLPVSAVDYQKPPQSNLHNEKKRKPSIIHQLVADEVGKPYDLTEKRKQSSSLKKNSVRFSSKLIEEEYMSIGSVPSNDSCDSGCAPCKTFSSETQFQDTSSVSLNIGIDNGGDSSEMSFCRRFGEACESIYVKIFDDEEDFVDTIPPPRVIVSSNDQQRHPSRQRMDTTFRSDLMCCWQGGSSSSAPTEEVAGECCRINSSSSSLASSISSTSSFIKDKNRRKNWFQDPRAHCDTSSRRHNTNNKNKVNIYAENKPTADNGDASNREAGRRSSRVGVAVQSKNNNKFPLPRHSRKASKKETTTHRHQHATSDSASPNLGCKVPSGATILNKSSIINHTNQGRSQQEDTDRNNGGFWQTATKLGRQFNIEIPKPLKSKKAAGAPKKGRINVDNRRSRHNKETAPSNTAKKGVGSWWKAAGTSLSSFMACTNEEILMENIQDDDDDDDIFASEFNSTVETTVTFGEGEAESATLQDVIRLD